MKHFVSVAALCLSFSLFAEDEVKDEEFVSEEEMVCDVPYEAMYAKCSIDEEHAAEISEQERKLLELDPYKAKGKFFINQKKGQLQVWLGRPF